MKLDINWKPDRRALRSFGFGGAVFLPIVAAILWWRGVSMPWVYGIAAVGAPSLLFALVEPLLLRPLYIVVTAVTAPIGLLVNGILMLLIFYGMFLPLGLIFRLIGRDALQRKLEPERDSYWQEHRRTSDAGRYFKQY